MSLKHGYTDPIADVPADAVAGKVLPSHWNAEHTFPGANPGEVVFVDGSGHAATDPNCLWDANNKLFALGSVVSGASQITGFVALGTDSASGGVNAVMGTIDSTDQVAVFGYGSYPGSGLQWYVTGLGHAYFDSSGNGYVRPAHLGIATDGDVMGATGYFGTSVESPLLSVASGAVDISNDGILGSPNVRLAFSVTSLAAQFGRITLSDSDNLTWDDGTDTGTITSGLQATSSLPNAVLLVGGNGGISNDADLGAVGAEVRTGYFGTSVVTPLLTADAVTFPDADPHVAGAGYWVTGVLTKSAG
jgi:hypothetical protein